MSARITDGLIAALLLAAAAVSAEPLPAGADTCLAALAAAEERPGATARSTDPPRVGDICPAFRAALDRSAWGRGELLDKPPGELDRADIAALSRLAGPHDTADAPVLAAARLDDIVAALEPFVPEAPPTLWDRIREWLRGLTRSDAGEPTWLGRLLESISIPPALVRDFIYGLAAALVLAVLAVMISELGAAGLLTGRTRRPRAALATARRRPRGVDDFDAIRAMPDPGRRIELVFAFVVDRLRRRRRAALSEALTHRELEQAVSALDTSARHRLHEVADAAERVTYGGWQPDETACDSVLASGRSLALTLESAELAGE